jgi:hypothetical protein
LINLFIPLGGEDPEPEPMMGGDEYPQQMGGAKKRKPKKKEVTL